MILTFDNTGNPQTGDFRLGIGVQHANLFNRDHIGTFSYATSAGKEDQVSLYSGSYRLPLYSLGDSMDFIAAYSDVSAGTTQTVAGPLTFSGKGEVYGLRYNQLLARRGEYSHRLVYGLDYLAYKNACALGDFGAAGLRAGRGGCHRKARQRRVQRQLGAARANLRLLCGLIAQCSRRCQWAGE